MATVTGDIIRVVAGFSYDTGGRPMSNVLHLRDSGAGGIGDPALLVGIGLFLEVIYTTVQAVVSSRLKYVDYSVANITQGLIVGNAVWPTFTVGGGPITIDASQVVGLLRMVTPATKVQGRVNIAGIDETNISVGVISVGVQAAILAMGTAMIGPFIIAPSSVEYIVFNQTFKTFNLPTSVALGEAVRMLGKRKIPA